MGSTTFFTKARGMTPEEAFHNAREEARNYYGHQNYSGTIKEKDSYTIIDVPEDKDPVEYAEKLTHNDDDPWINDKWGPAGCILLEENKWQKPKTTNVENKTKSGRKKWNTVYKVLERDFPENRLITKCSTKTEAIEKAKELALENLEEYRVVIDKELGSHDNLEAVISPNELESNKGIERGNLYLFFGWASS